MVGCWVTVTLLTLYLVGFWLQLVSAFPHLCAASQGGLFPYT